MNQSVHNIFGQSCSFCVFGDACNTGDGPCEHFCPTDDDTYGDMVMDSLREERLIDRIMYDDGVDFRWSLNKDIDNMLGELRCGRLVCLENAESVETISRFEPKLNVVFWDGTYHLSL